MRHTQTGTHLSAARAPTTSCASRLQQRRSRGAPAPAQRQSAAPATACVAWRRALYFGPQAVCASQQRLLCASQQCLHGPVTCDGYRYIHASVSPTHLVCVLQRLVLPPQPHKRLLSRLSLLWSQKKRSTPSSTPEGMPHAAAQARPAGALQFSCRALRQPANCRVCSRQARCAHLRQPLALGPVGRLCVLHEPHAQQINFTVCNTFCERVRTGECAGVPHSAPMCSSRAWASYVQAAADFQKAFSSAAIARGAPPVRYS